MTLHLRDKPWFFEEYEIEGLPWVPIGNFPTRIHRLEKLSSFLGFDGIWIKRDDQTSNKYGGNKIRKFEFVIADALSKGKKWILTYGGLGSNQVLAMTIHSKAFGLKTIGILSYQPITQHVLNNLYLMTHFGTYISYASSPLMATLKTYWHILTKKDVYKVPVGASSERGVLGFVDAMFELKKQVENGEAPMPRNIFVAVGSAGTYAGLLLGKKLLDLDVNIMGVKVSTMKRTQPEFIAKLANKALNLLRSYSKDVPDVKVEEKDVILLKEYLGKGYGAPTQKGLSAISLLERTENIKLEPVYTGKTFAALVDFVKREGEGPVLFWNTYNSVDFSDILKNFSIDSLPEKIQKIIKPEITKQKQS